MSNEIEWVWADTLRRTHGIAVVQLKQMLTNGDLRIVRVGNTNLINIKALNSFLDKLSKEQMAKFDKKKEEEK